MDHQEVVQSAMSNSCCASCAGYQDLMQLRGFAAATDAAEAGSVVTTTAGYSPAQLILIGLTSGVLIHFATKALDKVFR
jgi:hypothetical protein